MSFDLKTKHVKIDTFKDICDCYVHWRKLIRDTSEGSLTITGDSAKSLKIEVSRGDNKLEVEISNVVLHHEFNSVYEQCSSGCPELSKHYNLEIVGQDQKKSLTIYVNHTSEDGGATWTKILFPIHLKVEDCETRI